MYIYLLCACLSVSIYHFSRMLYCQSTNIPQLKPPTPALYVCLHLSSIFLHLIILSLMCISPFLSFRPRAKATKTLFCVCFVPEIFCQIDIFLIFIAVF